MSSIPLIVSFLGAMVIILLGLAFSGIIGKKKKIKIRDNINMTKEEIDILKKSEQKGSFFEKKQYYLQQSGTGVSLPMYISILIGSMVAIFIIANLVLKSPIFALVISAMGFFIPNMYVKNKIKANIDSFNLNLVKALRRMASNLRAGNSLKQSLYDVCKSNTMPLIIRKEFSTVLMDMEYGKTIDESLQDLYKRTGSEDVKNLAIAIEVQRKIGGKMDHTFDNISKLINQKKLSEAEIKSTLAQSKASATMLSIMPFVLSAILMMISPGYFKPMYEFGNGMGKLIIAGAYGIIIIGVVVMNKLADIKV